MIFLYIILGLALLLYIYLTWNFDYWSKRGIPAAKAKILLGNLPNLLLRRQHVVEDFGKIYAEYKGKTPFIGVLQIRAPRLVLFEPELIKDVLIRKFKNFHDNEFGDMVEKDEDPLLARNPFLLKGEEWKDKRGEITPAFTSTRLKALYPLIEDVQGRMIKYIEQQIKNREPLEAREVSAKFTTDVVSNAIFGVDAQSFTKDKAEIREMGRKLMAPNGWFIIKMFLVAAAPFLKKVLSMRFVSVDIEKFFIDLMKQALKYREENNVQREDFLDYLIQLRKKKGLEDIEMAAHTISFFTDGFETSSVAIAHVLYELGRNKHVQDKLRVELDKNCDNDGKISFENINELPYLDQVWSEALRLHSPAGFLGRKCTEDIVLEFEGQKALIEKEINVYIPVHQIHYDPEYYSKPEEFKPERFDPENGGVKAFRDKGVYLPFGDGPRMCLGMRFAQLQSKAAIASIIKKFELSVNSKTTEEYVIDPIEFISVKAGGMWLDFKPITPI